MYEEGAAVEKVLHHADRKKRPTDHTPTLSAVLVNTVQSILTSTRGDMPTSNIVEMHDNVK